MDGRRKNGEPNGKAEKHRIELNNNKFNKEKHTSSFVYVANNALECHVCLLACAYSCAINTDGYEIQKFD